ncbi:hypothetical protein Q5692_08795 [Microcoleus sp. C2C3]|uniref:hypothetical protein n=1 Tax=unclassified Microcoleus TaxID=2642155 RepID=UPI002FD425ED
MSVKEILTSVNLIGGTDAITFEPFIIRKLVPKLWKGACVVIDNCPIHLGEEVKKAIEKKGARLIYLSPEMLNVDTKLYISRYSKTNQVKISTKHEFLKPMNKTNFLTHTSLKIANLI